MARIWMWLLMVVGVIPAGLGQTVAIPRMTVFSGTHCALPIDPGCTLFVRRVGLEAQDPTVRWRRSEVEVPPSLRALPQLALLVRGDAPYRVYVNGQMIGGVGSFERRTGPLDAVGYFVVPSQLAHSSHLTIAIEELHLPRPLIIAPAVLPTRLGSITELRQANEHDTLQYLRGQWLHYLCFLLVLCAGCFFLLLFATQRRSREYLWLGLSLIALGLIRAGELGSTVDLGWSVAAGGWQHALCNTVIFVALVEFAFALNHRRVPWPARVLEACFPLAYFPPCILLLPIPQDLYLRLCGPLFTWSGLRSIPEMLLYVCLLLPLLDGWRSRDVEMRCVNAALVFFSLESVLRTLGQMGLPTVTQDVMVDGLDVDLRAISLVVVSLIMIAAMTVRYQRLQGRNSTMESEIAAARTVQQVLIPDILPAVAGLTIESVYMPAQEVGGDFFQVLPLADGAAFVVLGDVSGKGLKAAMTVSLIVGTLRTYAEFYSSPGELLAGLNRRLHGRNAGFATCLALKVERCGKVTMANTGHPNAYLDGVEVETEASLPLGIVEEIAIAETSFVLGPEQRLTLVTDGVIEAAHAKTREMFGFARTLSISRQPAQTIADAAREFGGTAAQADDITVLSLMRVGVA